MHQLRLAQTLIAFVLCHSLWVGRAAARERVQHSNLDPTQQATRLVVTDHAHGVGGVLELREASMDVLILGPLFQVTLWLTFYNPHASPVQGELEVAVPEKSTVCGFAMEAQDGTMLDAVPVSSLNARLVFEKPSNASKAISHHAAGNVFRAAVNHIGAKIARKLKVMYSGRIHFGFDNIPEIRLPAQFSPPPRGALKFHLETVETTEWSAFANLTIYGLNGTQVLTSFQTNTETGTRTASHIVHNCDTVPIANTLTFQLQHEVLPESDHIVLVETHEHDIIMERPRSHTRGLDFETHSGVNDDGDRHDSTYFTLFHYPRSSLLLELKSELRALLYAQRTYQGTGESNIQTINSISTKYRLRIFWDSSLSRSEVDKTRSFEFLQKLVADLSMPSSEEEAARRSEPGDLDSIPPPPRSGVYVEVYEYRAVSMFTRQFHIVDGDSHGLLEYLKAVTYDGGTGLADLPFSIVDSQSSRNSGDSQGQWTPTEFTVMFSDGFVSTDSSASVPDEYSQPVFCVAEGPRANYALLHKISTLSHGCILNLNTLTMADAISRIKQPRIQLLSVHYEPEAVSQVYPQIPQILDTSGVEVTGKLLKDSTTVTLNYGVVKYGSVGAGEEVHILRSIPFVINSPASEYGGLVPRFWAQHKTFELLLFPDHNRIRLAELGQHFGLVSSATSLLVLESLSEYVEHKVAPPISQPELRQKYIQLQQHDHKTEVRRRAMKKENVKLKWHRFLSDWQGPPTPSARAQHTDSAPASATSRKDAPLVSFDSSVLHSPQKTGHNYHPSEPAAQQSRASYFRSKWRKAKSFFKDAFRRSHKPSSSAPPTPPALMTTVMHTAGQTLPDIDDDDQPPSPEAIAERSGSDQPDAEADGSSPEEQASSKSDRRIREIHVHPWNPQTPYLKDMLSAYQGGKSPYSVYLRYRDQSLYLNNPGFYYDCGDFLLSLGPAFSHLGVRVLMNIVELNFVQPSLYRSVAYRLQQLATDMYLVHGCSHEKFLKEQYRVYDLTVALLKRVLHLRPEDPQSFRDMATTLASRAKLSLKVLDSGFSSHLSRDTSSWVRDAREAFHLFHTVIDKPWENAEDIEVPALVEVNHLLAAIKRSTAVDEGGRSMAQIYSDLHRSFGKDYLVPLEADIRISCVWDSRHTHADMRVIEPSQETVYFRHPRSQAGGLFASTQLRLHGPEEYFLRRASSGAYRVQIHLSPVQHMPAHLIAPPVLQISFFAKFGSREEQFQTVSIQARPDQSVLDVGGIRFTNGSLHVPSSLKPRFVQRQLHINSAATDNIHKNPHETTITGSTLPSNTDQAEAPVVSLLIAVAGPVCGFAIQLFVIAVVVVLFFTKFHSWNQPTMRSRST